MVFHFRNVVKISVYFGCFKNFHSLKTEKNNTGLQCIDLLKKKKKDYN